MQRLYMYNFKERRRRALANLSYVLVLIFLTGIANDTHDAQRLPRKQTMEANRCPRTHVELDRFRPILA
jgi:hypothetical protein